MTPDTRRHLWNQLPFALWLMVLWMLLWGQLTVLGAVTGAAVAVFVMAVFRLPPADLSARVNLWHSLVFVVVFVLAVVRGALTVAWQTLSPGTPGAAVIRVPLRIDDDFVMTHTAVTSSLIPGSLVLEADRDNRVLYLHAIGIRTMADVEEVRRGVQQWEVRAVKAIGSRAHLELIRSDAPTVLERHLAERTAAS